MLKLSTRQRRASSLRSKFRETSFCRVAAKSLHCSLASGSSDEELTDAVTEVFGQFGTVYVKIRRDSRGMPYAFCQYTVRDVPHALAPLVQSLTLRRTRTMPRMPSSSGRTRSSAAGNVAPRSPRSNVRLCRPPCLLCCLFRADFSTGALYASKHDGSSVDECEVRSMLERYGMIEKIFAPSETEKEIFALPNGLWVRFAYFQDCRDAQSVIISLRIPLHR